MRANGIALRTSLVYALLTIVGIAAFTYPFFLPSSALPNDAHAGDAPLVSALVALLALAAVALELRRRTMSSATVAVLGVLTAICALLRLLDLPGGGSGIFFLVVLAGAAFGPRFGLLLGLCAMALSAIFTAGLGPWLPFQMLTLSWIGAGAGVLGRATRRMHPVGEVAVLAAYGWCCAFIYGAVMNLWFWPFQSGGGDLAWTPGLTFAETLQHYWRFYVSTSLAWDAAGAIANAALIAITGLAVLHVLRRVEPRLEPVADLV
jgi:energy-coupling factor transport system substrate-specific component